MVYQESVGSRPVALTQPTALVGVSPGRSDTVARAARAREQIAEALAEAGDSLAHAFYGLDVAFAAAQASALPMKVGPCMSALPGSSS